MCYMLFNNYIYNNFREKFMGYVDIYLLYGNFHLASYSYRFQYAFRFI